MIRALLILVLCALPRLAPAQDTPRVSVEMDATETVVGQPLIVRIKVLVPTFSPKPPEFPALEVPGLIVRLPERASAPVSETIDGETWSGVQRSYRLYPLQPGSFEIPAQTVRVSYAEPGGITPLTVELSTDAIRFAAVVPPEAAGLSPLILSKGFTLSQTLELPAEFAVGDAVERRVEAQIAGTTPILIPQLIAALEAGGLRAYPKDPAVTETEERGVLSGTRTEAVTYLAAGPGEVALPAIAIEWFNLETNQIETARVEGAALTITGEAAAPEAENLDWRQILAALAVLAAALWALRKIWPRITRAIDALRARWQASEAFAFRQVRRAMRHRDLSQTYAALRAWSAHFPEGALDGLAGALAGVGGARYAGAPPGQSAEAWRLLSTQVQKLRQTLRRVEKTGKTGKSLPPLNSLG